MRHSRFSLSRIACGLLLSTALFACDASLPVGIEDAPQQARVGIQQCMNVEIDAIYSGPPSRDPNIIDLNDQWVYVEILDVETYLGQNRTPPPAPSDVRIGDSWEDGTPAESYQILDINNDGTRDIRLRFSKFDLINDGNLDQETTELQVWGLDRSDNGEYCGSEPVEVIVVPPAPGQDVVVFNDVNPFDNTAMAQPTDNEQMVRNLVSFNSEGPRNEGNVVWWDYGRNSGCAGCVPLSTTQALIAAEGFTLQIINSAAGTLVGIPANVKSIWLWLPNVAFTTAEINALKQFAAEGGRIVFIGEWDGFYGANGLAVENQFLRDMGAVMRNTGGAVDCGYTYLPGSSIQNHQVTNNVDDLTIACASVIEPGPQDFVLFYDTSGTQVLAGVARIDTTPLSGVQMFSVEESMAPLAIDPNLDPNSTTGR